MPKKTNNKAKKKDAENGKKKDAENADNAADDAVFQLGDRVVLQGLKKMKRLNGRHGTVVSDLDEDTGRYRIDMDLLDQLVTVTAKPVNIKREAAPNASFERAQVKNGCLAENHGRAFSLIIDMIRYLVAFCLHDDPDIRHYPDIERVKDTNMEKAQFLTATGWSFWEDPGAHQGTGGRGIYESLLAFLPDFLGVVDGNMDHFSEEQKRPLVALTDPVAVAGWNLRIHGNFWIVGKDPVGGTFVVPDANKRAVYKVFGMTSCLYDLISGYFPFGKPVKVKITMVPWYGRLVYDGTVGPIDPMPSNELVQELRQAVEVAQVEGRVVDRLVQLELSESAAANGETTTTTTADVLEAEATREERLIIASLVPIKPYPAFEEGEEINPGAWVFRRMDYTEEKNPRHMGLLMSAGNAIGPFECSALEPSSTDILKWLVQYSLKLGKRPRVINIDDKACAERVEYLLKDVKDIRVDYYPPPTEEELAAIAAMERAGKDPF